jgi:hypothetical protein
MGLITGVLSRREVGYAAIGQFILCAALVALVSQFPPQNNYTYISAAIRHWDFRAVPTDQPREFWGLSYLSAAIAGITSMSDGTAILSINFCAYLVTIFFCERLWGPLVAAWFAAVDWFWLDTSVAGGSEPLFMALLLASFVAIRKEKWVLATVAVSLATVVRPVGVVALLAIGIVLLKRHEIRRLLLAVSVGLLTGVLYLVPMALIYGNPLAGVRSYQVQDWAGASPITIPLLPIIRGAIFTRHTMRLPLQILVALWVLLTVAAVIRLAGSTFFRHYAKKYPVEAIFAGLYAVVLFSYNTNFWAWQHFPRFAIPLLPFVLLAFRNRLPSSRLLLCGVAAGSIICVVLPKAGVAKVSGVIQKLAAVERTTLQDSVAAQLDRPPAIAAAARRHQVYITGERL